MTRPSEHIRRQRRQSVYRPRELATTMLDSAEEDRSKDSVTTTKELAKYEEYMTRPKGKRQPWRHKGLDDGPKVYTMTMEVSAEEYEYGDFINNNGGVGRG